MARKYNRRDILKMGALAAGGAAAAAAAAYGTLWEPRHPEVETVEIRLRRLPEAFDGLRIAQISDVHWGPYVGQTLVSSAVERANRLAPHLAVLTGDFVSRPLGRFHPAGSQYAVPCAQALRALQAPLGTLAILGNHDHYVSGKNVNAAFEEAGIPVLRNRALPLEQEGARLWIAGVDDALVRKSDLPAALGKIPAGEATILLVHEPDFADLAARHPVDLQLSGHSHGGQVRMPGVGALILPPMAEKYPMGLYRIGDLQLYTNRGLGTIFVPVRFLCPPEVTLITLRKT